MHFTDEFGYTHGFEEDEQLPRYLAPFQVMELLCIGKNTFYKLVNAGELKGFRIGKQWRIPREELVRYATAAEPEPKMCAK